MARPPDTRQRIKDEAMRLFVASGVDAVSVRDIADAVGMKAPNLYAHFGSRDALIHELFAQGYADYGSQLAQAAAAAEGFNAKLEVMVRLICKLHDRDTIRFRFLLLSQHFSLPSFDPATQANPVDVLQQTVQAAMQRGELPVGDVALRTAMIVGVVLQAATFILYGRVTERMEQVADRLVAACLGLSRV